MSTDLFSLKNKVALVTGCASGLGKAIALAFADSGAKIVGVYNSHEPNELKKEINVFNGEFTGLKYDLKHENSYKEIIARAVETYGRLDILANVAGICPRNTIFDFNKNDWDDTIAVNQKAVYFLSQAAVCQYRQQESRGKIINIASMYSYFGGVNASAYTATKHAVVGITKAMASESGQYGINVNAIAPGWFATNLSAPIMENKERTDSILSRLPVGRWGKPSELCGTAIFLASSASDFVNGVVIPVDGGYLTR